MRDGSGRDEQTCRDIRRFVGRSTNVVYGIEDAGLFGASFCVRHIQRCHWNLMNYN